MSKIPVGCELYSVRFALAEDLPGTVKAVAEMGYDGVEFFGVPQHSAADYKQVLDDAGTAAVGGIRPLPTCRRTGLKRPSNSTGSSATSA